MEFTRSVETRPRGVYCGAIGLVGPPDARVRARFSVAIRTAVIDTVTGEAVYGTGGGITWSSDAAAEHDEVLAKAAVLRSGSVGGGTAVGGPVRCPAVGPGIRFRTTTTARS